MLIATIEKLQRALVAEDTRYEVRIELLQASYVADCARIQEKSLRRMDREEASHQKRRDRLHARIAKLDEDY